MHQQLQRFHSLPICVWGRTRMTGIYKRLHVGRRQDQLDSRWWSEVNRSHFNTLCDVWLGSQTCLLADRVLVTFPKCLTTAHFHPPYLFAPFRPNPCPKPGSSPAHHSALQGSDLTWPEENATQCKLWKLSTSASRVSADSNRVEPGGGGKRFMFSQRVNWQTSGTSRER